MGEGSAILWRHVEGACGQRLRPGPENSIEGRGLFERSEFRSPHYSGPGHRHPKGRARAPMVLGSFAETKEPRRVGAKPRILPSSAGAKPRKKAKTLDSRLLMSRMTDEDKKKARSYRATKWRLRARLRPGPENSIEGRGLFERSEFRSPHYSGLGQRHPKGRARAPMVLGPFAETKGPRRVGPKPRIALSLVVRGAKPPHDKALDLRLE